VDQVADSPAVLSLPQLDRHLNSVLVEHPRAVDRLSSPVETPLANASSRTLARLDRLDRQEPPDWPVSLVKQARKASLESTPLTSPTPPPRDASHAQLDPQEAPDHRASLEFVECVDPKETQASLAATVFQALQESRVPREHPERTESPELPETRARTLRGPSDAKDLVDRPENPAQKDLKENRDHSDLKESPDLLDLQARQDSKDLQDLTEKKDPRDRPESPERTQNTAHARIALERNPAARAVQAVAAAVVRAAIAVLAYKRDEVYRS